MRATLEPTTVEVLPESMFPAAGRVSRHFSFIGVWVISTGLLFLGQACKQYRVAPFDGATSDGDADRDLRTDSPISDAPAGEDSEKIDSVAPVDSVTDVVITDGGGDSSEIQDAPADGFGVDATGPDGGGASDRFAGDAGGVGALCSSGSDCQSGCCETFMAAPSICQPRGYCADTCIPLTQTCTSSDECCSGKCTNGPMPPNSCVNL